MQLRALLIVGLLTSIPLGISWHAASSSAPVPQPEPDLPLPRLTQDSPPRYLGAGSCSAAACHNGDGGPAQPRTEYAVWLKRDRHARAFEILYDDRSVRIQKNLGVSTLAHEDYRCLSCHVVPGLTENQEKKAPYFRVDGVSCESCHGPAEKWVALHVQESWQTKTMEEKQSLGMTDTQSVVGRAKTCVGCHVGGPGQDVDHDLIAAGHPRLNFEFSSFHAAMPHHWSDARDRDPLKSPRGRSDFDARAWLAGQVISTHAAVELLAERAADSKRPWPEFAEHDCYACHHDLQSPSWRQRRGQQLESVGSLVWSRWYTTMTPQVLQALRDHEDPLAALRKEQKAGWKKRQAIAAKAKQCAMDLQVLAGQLDRKLAEPVAVGATLRQLLRQNLSKYGDSWDEASEFGLSLAAMQRAQQDMNEEPPAGLKSAIEGLMRDLEFPKSYDSPRRFDGQAVRDRLLELHELGEKMGR